MAYAACENASYDPPEEGNVGAGTGCTVGKYKGAARAMKSGFGTFAVEAGAVRVGAMVAVNALGDICGPDGKPVAGLLAANGKGLSSTVMELMDDVSHAANLFSGNTTLGIVVTNCSFRKPELCKIAGMTHNGYARAIRPVHTTADGDSIYAVSTGSIPGDVNLVGTMAAYAMERAIVRAATSATSAYGFRACRDL